MNGGSEQLRAEIVELRQRIRELEAAARRDASVVAGMYTINRPLQHTGELLGFFSATPQLQAEAPTTLEGVVAVLRGYGLVR